MEFSGRALSVISQAARPRLKSQLLCRITSTEYFHRRGIINWCKPKPKPRVEPEDPFCPPTLQIPAPPCDCESSVTLPEDEIPQPKPCPMPLPPIRENPQVVVIGAGIAGLTAAVRLLDAGLTNITVLEARGRPGGRIQSTVVGDVIAELGADVCYPSFDSLPFRLAAADGLLEPVPRMDPARSLLTHPDGHQIDYPVALLAYQRYRKVEKEFEAFVNSTERQEHGDFAEIIGRRLRLEVLLFPAEHRYAAARIMMGLAATRRMSSSRDNRFIRIDYQGAVLDFPGALPIPLGLRGALAGLLRRIGPDIPKYNKVVTNIRWGITPTANPQVTVCCEDGDIFAADYAIITMPLGVLKDEHQALFCPPLPYDKVVAIDALEIKHVNKIFLEYSKDFAFWSGSPTVVRSPDQNIYGNSWVSGIVRLSEHPGSNYVLSGIVIGKHAIEMEMQNDAEVIEAITQVLRQSTGEKCVPYPVDMVRSKWHTERFTSGANTSQEFSELRTILSEPCPEPASSVTPALLFAGEATSNKPGTIQGAALSGLREAQRLLDILERREEKSACKIKVECAIPA